MQKLLSYSVPQASGQFSIQVPEDSITLSISELGNQLVVNIISDNSKPSGIKRFLLAETGDAIEKIDMRFIGSAQLKNVGLTFHLFEVS